jgi:hypothetical protein
MVKIVAGIAALGLLVVGFFVIGRATSTRLAALNGSVRAVLFVLVLILTSLAPIEFFTQWSLSSVPLANSAYLISFLAYLLLVVALWAETKARSNPGVRTVTGGLALALFFLTVGALASPVALFLIVAWSLQPPSIASGQIAPGLTYVLDHRQNWGGGYSTEYRIYWQLPALPVHRLLAKGDACYTDHTPSHYHFQTGPDPGTVVLTCNFPDLLGTIHTCSTTISVPSKVPIENRGPDLTGMF